MKILTNTSLNSQGELLIQQETLQQVFERSGPLAVNNEFQVHYWAAIYRLVADDGSILDVAVPTVLFNYPQVVSGAHIDFELKDVSAMSAKVEPLHKAYISKLPLTLEIPTVATLKLIGSSLHSIHRHPGSHLHQGFSGIDLDTNPGSPGVVFPLKSGNNVPNFASIMAITEGHCMLAHTEYRLVNTVNQDVMYTKCRAVGSMVITSRPLSKIEHLLGYKEGTATTLTKFDENEYSVLDRLMDQLTELPLPQVIVSKENLTKKPQIPYSSWDSIATKARPLRLSTTDALVPKILTKDELQLLEEPHLRKLLIEIDTFLGYIDKEEYIDFDKGMLVECIMEGYEDLGNQFEDILN